MRPARLRSTTATQVRNGRVAVLGRDQRSAEGVGVGKSWVALHAVVQALGEDRRVLFLGSAGSGQSILERLGSTGAEVNLNRWGATRAGHMFRLPDVRPAACLLAHRDGSAA